MNSITFINPPPAEVLKKGAYKRFAAWGPNEDKPYNEAQGAVNYIRHVLTNYDALRREIRLDVKDDENNQPDILSLKLETLAGIKERYPELRTECTRQEEWLRGRATALTYSRAKYSSPNPGMISMAPALDLIGAGAEEKSSLGRRIAELEKALAEDEVQYQKINAELYAIRKMVSGRSTMSYQIYGRGPGRATELGNTSRLYGQFPPRNLAGENDLVAVLSTVGRQNNPSPTNTNAK